MATNKPQPPFNEPSSEHRTPAEILRATRQVLQNAERGLDDIKGNDPSRRISGLHNVVVFGRAVTLGLQRLRHIVSGFDEWYNSLVPEKDPLLTYVNKFRNMLLKEVSAPQPTTWSYIEYFSGNPADALQGPAPDGATEFFIGEGATGGSGWIVRLPDGSESKYYAALSPTFQSKVETYLPDPPNSFLGEELTDQTVAGVATLYVNWLQKLVADAERQFTPS